MKKSYKPYYPVVIIGVFLILIRSCKNEDPPTLTTIPVGEITGSTAQSGGDISDDGGAFDNICIFSMIGRVWFIRCQVIQLGNQDIMLTDTVTLTYGSRLHGRLTFNLRFEA